MTNKEIICIQGKQERRFKIDRFSDQALTEGEFKQWKDARSKAGQKPLTKEECVAIA